MEPLNIGVVGAGYMGRSFARLVAQHPLARLTGVADINNAAAAAVADAFGAAAYASAEALLDRERLDGLIVATFEDAHRAPCLAALSRGVATLVEKPIASTLADGEAIVEAARASGAMLMVGHVLRFDARYAQVQSAVASGHIGTPLTATARRLNGKAAQKRLNGRSSLATFLGVHDYDAVRWIVGAEVHEVVARSRVGFLKGQGYDVEDATWALLTFDNGVIAAIEEGWILPDGHPSGFEQRLEVNGTTGRAEIAAAYQGLTLITDQRAAWPDTALWPTINGQVGGSLEREVAHFLSEIRSGQPPLVSGQDGLAALRIALAVEEAARTGQSVSLVSAGTGVRR